MSKVSPPSGLSGSLAVTANHSPARWRFPRAGVLVLTLLMVAGCGTGTYKKRAAERLEELRRKSNFLGMLDRNPYEVSDAQSNMLGVWLRLPAGFQSKGRALRTGFKEPGGHEGEYVIPEERVQPPFMTFQNFCMSFEWFVPTIPTDWKNRELPVYCYFAVTRAQTPEGDPVEQQEILDRIQEAVAKAFGGGAAAAGAGDGGDAPAAGGETDAADGEESADGEQSPSGPLEWKTLTLDTPDDEKIEWKRLRATGEQFFDATSRRGENILHEGRFDVYVHSDDAYHVVVAFRAPVCIDNNIHLMEAGQYSAATLTVKAPPPPPPAPEANQQPATAEESSGS